SSNWRHSFITRRGKRQWLFALWSFLCGWPRTFRRGIRKRRCRRIWSEWRKLSERKFIQRMNDLPPRGRDATGHVIHFSKIQLVIPAGLELATLTLGI